MHYGKQYPRQPKNLIQMQESGSFGAPIRKERITESVGDTSGTVAAQWQGVDVVSSIADYWPDDPTWLVYIFECPTNPDSTVKFRCRYKEDESFGSFSRYRCEWFFESWLVGFGKIADYGFDPITWNNFWGTAGVQVNAGPAWHHLTNPALWTQVRLDLRMATWADQPEFQPYHTRP